MTNTKNVLRNKKERSNAKERKRKANIQECMHRCHTTNAQSPKPINITMRVKAFTANLPE
jgi:hypothetical protein